jgi:hypothetical protein
MKDGYACGWRLKMKEAVVVVVVVPEVQLSTSTSWFFCAHSTYRRKVAKSKPAFGNLYLNNPVCGIIM